MVAAPPRCATSCSHSSATDLLTSIPFTTLYKFAVGVRVFEILGKLADVGVKLAFEAPPSPEPITLTQAWKEFLTDAKARNLREPTLYKYANESKWIDENHARQLESPKVQRSPTMPFAQDQMAEILIACEKYGNKARGGMYRGPENARRIRAFVLFLRHSGLRIGDAVTLERRRITADKLLLYTAKTGTPVRLPLGQDVILTRQRIKRTVSSFPSS